MWKIELIKNTRLFSAPVSAKAIMQKNSQLSTEIQALFSSLDSALIQC